MTNRSKTIMSEGSLSDMDIKIATSSLSMHKTFRVRLKFLITFPRILGFPGSSMVKNPPANSGDARDIGSIPRWEDLLEKEMAIHFSILAWKIPWKEEPGGLLSMWSQRVRHEYSC